MTGACDAKGAMAVAAVFVASGAAIGILFEAADAMGHPPMYASITTVAAFMALAISCIMLFVSMQNDTEYRELMGWCREPDLDEDGQEQVDKCMLATGVKFAPMVMIITTAVLGCLTATSLLVLLPMGYELTGDRVAVKYDLLMMLLIAPVFEIKIGALKYSYGQKVGAVITAIAMYIALSACPCPPELEAVEDDVYLQNPMVVEEAEPFVDVALVAGILLRWASWCQIIHALQALYAAMHGMGEDSRTRVRFFSVMFLFPFTVMAAIAAIDEAEESESVGMFTVWQIVATAPFIATILPMLAWRGVYFVTVMVAFHIMNRSLFRVVCTPYSLPIFAAGALLAVWYQVSFWRKVPWDRRKTRLLKPADAVLEMEEVGGDVFEGTVHTDFKTQTDKNE